MSQVRSSSLTSHPAWGPPAPPPAAAPADPGICAAAARLATQPVLAGSRTPDGEPRAGTMGCWVLPVCWSGEAVPVTQQAPLPWN